MGAHLLIVEDDESLNQMLELLFEEQGHRVKGLRTCADALAYLNANAVDLILLDQQLPDGSGLELLQQLQQEDLGPEVIMITGQHDLELAIEAIKEGAADFIHKPIKTEALCHIVKRTLDTRRLSREVVALQSQPMPMAGDRELIGRSEAMLEVSKEIALSAENTANVLITGESGTGKEVVARLIHRHSKREGPFVALNCAAIVDTLLESELFGHEKGAFTGATARKPGKFELAQDGTIFLDEIGDMAPTLQAKLLRVLQEHAFERVGGTQQINTNARVIAATHRDLVAEAREGRFREDLAYRLQVISIHLPPLRERKEDIPLLAHALVERIAQNIHRPIPRIAEQTLVVLQSHDWPGNVRELENVLTQAVVHAREGVITPDFLTLPSGRATTRAAPHLADTDQTLQTLEQVEAAHIQRVLNATQGHKGRSCEILKISRPALDRKIKKYALVVPG